MIGLIQRVTSASVHVSGEQVASIDHGLMVLVGVEKEDSEPKAIKLLEKIISYRVFSDSEGKMNLGLRDISGGLMLVPQFTLAADTKKGLRPGFSAAASPGEGKRLFSFMVTQAFERLGHVESGVFGADMQITLVNDGPVTFWLQI